ncbi:hypothetical protein KSP40_PGU013150 [Platanthera guangdongensis]|uniref:Tubulin-folding cofactor D ARM repeats domain-containing protein n=1 Tax=Platanthera guangdongensis TaxID=2320717 RepID=A0ABR2M8L7_9ASPA
MRCFRFKIEMKNGTHESDWCKPVRKPALHYDIRRGPHSIGSHVRDAAAYVCWAFGRAYNYSDMKDILEQLAPHLLTVACYDREVNCRRAASAAFQENIGRLGTFSHGIDIVSSADYFSLASRANSYLIVAVSIAQFKEYLYPFVEELLNNKISHWLYLFNTPFLMMTWSGTRRRLNFENELQQMLKRDNPDN